MICNSDMFIAQETRQVEELIPLDSTDSPQALHNRNFLRMTDSIQFSSKERFCSVNSIQEKPLTPSTRRDSKFLKTQRSILNQITNLLDDKVDSHLFLPTTCVLKLNRRIWTIFLRNSLILRVYYPQQSIGDISYRTYTGVYH